MTKKNVPDELLELHQAAFDIVLAIEAIGGKDARTLGEDPLAVLLLEQVSDDIRTVLLGLHHIVKDIPTIRTKVKNMKAKKRRQEKEKAKGLEKQEEKPEIPEETPAPRPIPPAAFMGGNFLDGET